MRGRYTDRSLLLYLGAVEEALRAKAVEGSRSTAKVAWGAALSPALKDDTDQWNAHRHLLVERSTRSSNVSSSHVTHVKAARFCNKFMKRNIETVWQDGQGNGICKYWNDNRKCQSKRCRFSHVCDVRLRSTGEACGRKDHRRAQHDNNKHGAPATRS